MNYAIRKYPRTHHLEGSNLQAGDEDLSQVPFSSIAGKKIVVEEKCDGANSAISFDHDYSLLLQSRGHYLTGGNREKHFNLLKQWASIHKEAFLEVLGGRYIMYGEWVYAKHTIYYDRLPHYFLEFDIFDRETDKFLDTPSRHSMLKNLPVISVPVLKSASFSNMTEITDLVGPSNFIEEGHIGRLRDYCIKYDDNTEKRCSETDPSTTMEGLYIKVEQDGEVVERLKYIRRSFLQCVALSNSHWLSRPIIPNQLAYPVEQLFAPDLPDGIRTICRE